MAVAELTERELIDGWRLQELIRAGYPVLLAEQIAHSLADLHLALDLIAKGCDPLLASRIVL